jgi:hypothetical protein
MTDPQLTPWSDLDPETQLRLRAAYDAEQTETGAQGTCDWQEKTRRFNAFLARHGVVFGTGDTRR